MTTNSLATEQTYQYFLQESAELLQTMDDELQGLRESFNIQKVHNLMRAAHTLKGASASVGLDAVKKATHSLEDVFKALCYQDTVITVEMEGLIFQGYDCLKLLMSAQLAGAQVDEADILDRMATVVTRLQEMLGDRFGQGGHLPTSSELGFDMTQSIFQVGVAQRIDALEAALKASDEAFLDEATLVELLESQAEVFIGLAESLDLPGFGEIGKCTLQALDHSGDRVIELATVALANYKAAQAEVLAGDRERGGTPSAALLQLAGRLSAPTVALPAHPTGQLLLPPKRRGWLKSLWHSVNSPKDSHSRVAAVEATARMPQRTDVAPFQTHHALIGENPARSTSSQATLSQATSSQATLSQATLSQATLADPSLEDLSDLADLAPPELSDWSQVIEDATESFSQSILTQPIIDLPTAPNRSQLNNATIRMSVEHLDQLAQSMGELLTYQNRQALYNEQLADLTKKLLERIARQQDQLNQYRGHRPTSYPLPYSSSQASSQAPLGGLSNLQFDTLELDQYSDVQLLAQSCLEETVQQSENAEAIELFVTRAGQELEKQKRLLSNTRETLLAARMLPLEKVFQRFPPALERLQSQHHKRVNLELKGSDVLVDKIIADKLFDPMLHLVRNAFDHGIEPADRRRQHGKSAIGTITIEALQQGRHLVIHVKDDGQGFDLDLIRRKAIENQLISETEAATLTADQTIDLLFEAGFSMAGEVDELSGRGVGLDAVKAQVRSLQGWVSIRHEPGAGSCFTLQIPSSLTIAKLLLCQAQGRIYALIADAIEHILIPSAQQIRAWEGGKTLTWQAQDVEHLIPVNALADVLRYSSPLPSHRLSETRRDIRSAACDPIILLRHQNALVGLEVDQLLGEQELVISALGETIVPPPYLYGSSILPDGQLTLVLDGVMLAKIVLEQRSQGNIDISLVEREPTRIKPNNNEPVFVRKLILTVDDSITVRSALADALQKADYQVIQARDGAEALQQLERYPGVEAILCDIEMPGMNGFEFLKIRQQTPHIAAIPTIMLTSRAGAKHRLLTEELGATNYLSKPYLTPQLLKTLAEAIEDSATRQLSIAGESHE